VTGWTTTEKTPTDGAETVGSDGNITSAGGEAPAPQSESLTGDIQGRAVPRLAPGGMPPKLAPSTGLTMPPRPTPPQTAPAKPIPLTPPPTQNIAAVANAMTWNHKSLTTWITINPGLALTQPVTISIAYLSLMPGGPERQTQGYAASTGNRFVRADPEGDGQPRRVHLDITLSDHNPAGGVYNYNVPTDMDLDPLYDVAIGPLYFSLLNDCAFVGDTHIQLRWMNPIRQQGEMDFPTRGGRMTVVAGFAWSAQEVSVSHDLLLMPEFGLLAYSWLASALLDPTFGEAWDVQAHTILAPGPTQTTTIKGGLKAFNDNFCSAYFEYGITSTLRAYFGAPTVRDHRSVPPP